jgi:uncharacterized protein YcsI (UPF0317 family)
MLEEDPQAWIGANIYILKKEADSEFWLFSVRLPFSKTCHCPDSPEAGLALAFPKFETLEKLI